MSSVLVSAICGVESFLFTLGVRILLFLSPCRKPDQLCDTAERVPDWLKDVDARVMFGINFGKSRGFIKTGDPVIVITGWKQGAGFTNTFRLMYVDLE